MPSNGARDKGGRKDDRNGICSTWKNDVETDKGGLMDHISDNEVRSGECKDPSPSYRQCAETVPHYPVCRKFLRNGGNEDGRTKEDF